MWLTADTHFFHRNVIRFCDRPWEDIWQMNEGLIERWNAKVRPRDHIYVLGDFAFRGKKKSAEIVERLNGYKILVRGNHDPSIKKCFEIGFDEVVENEFLKIGDTRVLLSHFPWYPVINFHARAGGRPQITLEEHADSRYLHKRILDDGKHWLLHGHVHSSWKVREDQRMINVGCDVWDWSPVHHDTLLRIIKGNT